ADFRRCGSPQERPRQDPARPPAGGMDGAHEGVRMSTHPPRLQWLITTHMLSCPAKSDVSDFARLIAAEVGEGRLQVKAGHPITPRLALLLQRLGLLDRPLARAMTAERRSNFGIEIGTLFAAIAFAFASVATLHAEDVWRHGTLVPKGDA